MKRAPTAAIVLGVALVAAACGSSGPAEDSVSTADEPSADSATGDGAADTAGDETTDGEPPDAGAGGASALTGSAAEGWELVAIGEGTKPDLALDPDGVPGITFLFENLPEGFVAYATAADGWVVENFVEGYFYGPIGLDYGPDGRAHIAYHDHQESTFEEDLGDLTYAVLSDGEWSITAAASDGHDGWDSTIRVGDDGVVRAAGVDPAQFGRVEGLEYYELVDGAWQVEAIGTGPLEYEWNVDLQVAPDGSPALTYFLTDAQDLVFASRAADGSWTVEPVDTDGDVGRFSSLAIDGDGAAHISYWHGDTGEVRYATNAGGAWETTTIDTLEQVEIGFEGARRITSIALDPAGVPSVAYSDLAGIRLAVRGDDGTWTTEQILTAGDRPLGQLVSLEIDGSGALHLAFFEVTGNGPLSGVVGYMTPAG
ncbi:MAG: hypothetical protein OEU32_09680 [Acidimicrobiia bacterium]|nr:hypothetical protein [Acidimicrobiia bacterium]